VKKKELNLDIENRDFCAWLEISSQARKKEMEDHLLATAENRPSDQSGKGTAGFESGETLDQRYELRGSPRVT